MTSVGRDGAPATEVALLDNGRIGLLWMNTATLKFRLIPGFSVPEGSPARPVDNSPRTWVPSMVAAFNGGFRLSDHQGGFYYAGHTVSPLVVGLGSLVVTKDGRITVGAWGNQLSLGSGTMAVRQELPLLVQGHRSRASSTQSADHWGRANQGLRTANRSALGQRDDGSLVYAYGYEATATQLAAALVSVGVRDAMVLDMNKSWPNAFTYRHSGGTVIGQRVQSDMWREPSMYYQRFSKDFVVVEPR